MKKFIQKIKSKFKKTELYKRYEGRTLHLSGEKVTELPAKPNQANVYSLDTKTGKIRSEAGVLYVEASSLRVAGRHFKKLAEKRLKKKFTITKGEQ